MSRTKYAAPIVEAAERWKRDCLLDGGSLFGDERLWTRERFSELKRWFVDRPDAGSGSFLEKLKQQLEPAPPEAKRLMAETAWAYSLILVPRNMGRAKKVRDIRTIHEWSGKALPEDHPALGDVLGQGIASAGTAYNTQKWREFAYLVETMLEWCSWRREDRTSLLENPIRFAEWLDGLPGSDKRQFRHVLLFLLFPDEFEPILSTPKKRTIALRLLNADAAAVPVKNLDGIALDRELLQIRKRLQDNLRSFGTSRKPPPRKSRPRQSKRLPATISLRCPSDAAPTPKRHTSKPRPSRICFSARTRSAASCPRSSAERT